MNLPKSLKSFYNWMRKSPVDDLILQASKSNVDDIALGALDVVDDIPKTISLDDIAVDNWRKKQGLDDFSKSPITPSEFVNNYKSKLHDNLETRELLNAFPEQYVNAPTELDLALHADDVLEAPPSFQKMSSKPDYDALVINPRMYGQSDDPIDFALYPDGFEDPYDFTRYHTALEQGYSTRNAAPYIYPTSKAHFRSPRRIQREYEAIQRAFDPDPALKDKALSTLYSKLTNIF
jgi:hypothetical protein